MLSLRFRRCSSNTSPPYSPSQGLESVFPALQRGAILVNFSGDQMLPGSWGRPKAVGPGSVLGQPCLPAPPLSPNRGCWFWCFPPKGIRVNMKSSWLCFKWDWKWSQQGCILHPRLVLSRRKTRQGQAWLLDRTMPAPVLKDLEIHIHDLFWVMESLSVIVV